MTGMPDEHRQQLTMAPAPQLDYREPGGSVQSDLLRTAAALAQDWAGGDIDGLRALATTLYGCVPEAAGIIDGLAAELAKFENTLEEKAYVASRYGVKIGTDGRPPPVSAGPAADVTAASEQHWALFYRQVYEQAMVQVRHARQQAARQLMDLYAKIEPSQQCPPEQCPPEQCPPQLCPPQQCPPHQCPPHQALGSYAEPAMVTGPELLPYDPRTGWRR